MGRRYPLYDPEAEKKILEMAAELGGLGTTPSVPKIPLTEPSPAEMADEEEDPDADTPAPNSVEQLISRNPYDDAPRAVDKTAASVAEEQKGTPLQIDMGWVDELQKNVQSRMFDAQPLSQRDYGHAAEQFIDPRTQRGERTDLLGFDDEEGFSRDRQIARAREAYGDDTPPSRRLEDEFLSQRERLSDAQIRRRGAIIGLLGNLFTDDHSAGDRWAAGQRAAGRDYDAGLAQARAGDRANTRIDRGLAEAIAATGNVSPEEAVNLTYGHPLVKAFSSGMYSQGGRAEGQALGLNKEKLGIISKMIMSDNADERQRAVAELNSLTQLGVAGLNAQARQGQQLSPGDQARLLGSLLLRTVPGLTEDKAGAVAQGDTSQLTPEQVAQVQKVLPSLIATVNDPKTRGRVVGSIASTEATGEVKNRFAVEQSVQKAQQDPKYRTKYKNDWNDAALPFKNAWQAWSTMNQSDREHFVEWAQGGFTGAIQKFFMSEEGQLKGKAVRAVINALVKERSGSAVTGSEWERIAEEIGLEANNWGPFNNPEAITEHLKRSGELLTSHRKTFEDEIGAW